MMHLLLRTVSFLSFVVWIEIAAQQRTPCTIDLNNSQRPNPSPLFFLNKPGLPFTLPKIRKQSRVLFVENGDSLVLLCAGSEFTEIDGDQAIATCVGGTIFLVNGARVSFSGLSCRRPVVDVAVRTGRSCESGSTEIAVGFQSSYGDLPNLNSNLRTLLTVCHDESDDKTLYVKHNLHGGGVRAKDKDSSRPKFREGDFYPHFTTLSVTNAYTQKHQTKRITQAVGSSTLAEQYIVPSEDLYLARGHLAPDADFCWFQGQDATYWYVNVAPQWQIFNAGNWLQLENAVRNYASDRDRDVTIYTGTFEVMELIDINDNLQEIYLHVNSEENFLPVPRFFWKVLHDNTAKKAVAFVGINNPHLESVSDDYILCNDVCDKVAFVTWDVSNVAKGFMYCCTVQDLKKRIPYVPNLGNVGLISE